MYDTIRIGLHNLHKYESILSSLYDLNERTRFYYNKSPQEFKFEHKSKNIHLEAMSYSSIEGMIPIEKRGKMFLPSSHYAVSYNVSKTKNELILEYSIPKFYYGNNIRQMVKHFTPLSEPLDVIKKVNYQIDNSYKTLIKSISDLFNFINPLVQIDKEDVEIQRIDFSFNQFFNSEYEAKYMLNQYENITLSYQNRENVARTVYKSTIHNKTRNYSFKIYHKGEEFKKNDAKKLKKKLSAFEIAKLQKEADKILRFELTLRAREISRIYVNNFYRNNSKKHQLRLKVLSKIKTIEQTIANPNSKKNKKELGFQLMKIYKKYQGITEFNKHLGKVRKVFLEISDNAKLYNTEGEKYNAAPFEIMYDKTLNDFLLKRFYSTIKEFKIVESLTTTEFERRISDYNMRVGMKNKDFKQLINLDANMKSRKLSSRPLKQFYETVKELGWKKIKEDGIYSRQTIYNYKKKLEKLGIDINSTSTLKIPISLDFEKYLKKFAN